MPLAPCGCAVHLPWLSRASPTVPGHHSFSIGDVSGGHINPAVTIAMAWTRNIKPIPARACCLAPHLSETVILRGSWPLPGEVALVVRIPHRLRHNSFSVLYIVAQCGGAACGGGLLCLTFGQEFYNSGIALNPHLGMWGALFLEVRLFASRISQTQSPVDTSHDLILRLHLGRTAVYGDFLFDLCGFQCCWWGIHGGDLLTVDCRRVQALVTMHPSSTRRRFSLHSLVSQPRRNGSDWERSVGHCTDSDVGAWLRGLFPCLPRP